MTIGWQTKTLGCCCEQIFAGGDVPKGRSSKVRTELYSVPIYANGEQNQGLVGFTDVARVSVPCITVSARGTLGFTAIRNEPFYPAVRLIVLVPDLTQVSLSYLYYALIDMDFGNTGTSIPQLTVPNLKQSKLLVPPLDEQRRIVGVLDEAFAGLATAQANAEKNLHNARALFESHLNAVFTQRGEDWLEKTLEQIGKTQTGSTPKTSNQSHYGDFISFVKPGDFNTDGTLDYDKDGLSESGTNGARIVPAGSVLMVCIGATIGKCGYCDRDVTTNQQVNALIPNDGSFNRYIYYQMRTETFQRKVIHASGQATLPIINKSKWSALSVWLPPKAAQQKKIAAEFDALIVETQRLATIYERKLAALSELKRSLLHLAFTGQL